MTDLSIKVSIAGRSYPLSVKFEEEENIRKAANLIEKGLKDLESSYAVRDKHDLLAMVALQFATQVMEGKLHSAEDEDVMKKLILIEEKISNQL